MNKTTRFYRLSLLLILFAAIALRASAVVFTEDAEIGPFDTNYDGQDLVILDCTVTVDGSHTFSSLVLASNAVLTHSFSTNGQLSVAINVTNAPYVLSGTAPDELANSNIFSPLLVTDDNGNAYTNGVDYLEINQTNGTDIFTEIERTTNSSIPDGGTVLVSYSYGDTVPAGLDLTVTGVVWVANGCEINADGIGYGAGFGPGAGSSSSGTFFDGSGGGDGGSGGMSLSNAVGGVCYDSLYQPLLPGSGGGASYAGNGGNGGGLVRITASDEMEIDGVISANGENATNSRSGGGSGGSIWISAPSVSGSGSLSANGGLGAPGDIKGGGGGGGRISIVCGTNTFAGTITAYGGGGANCGGAGTVFTDLNGQPGILTLNNNGNVGANSTVALPSMADVTISGGAGLVAASPFVPRDVSIGTNCLLTAAPVASLQFSAANLTILNGGVMSVDGLGYAVGGGGMGGNYASYGFYYGGGGGYGGMGGAAAVTNAYGGAVYGDQNPPTGFGSSGGGNGGNGGAGGGWMNINVSGTLQVNGVISANGGNGVGTAGGGGSGGTIVLVAPNISGNGVIRANGGEGANFLGGGGGGGRILISTKINSFGGPVDCFGGGGANYGGAGTVYWALSGALSQLVLDNGGNTGPSTPIQSTGGNLTVQNGAWATVPLSSTFASLSVGSNSWVTVAPNDYSQSLTILGNAIFQAGGGFMLNADGFPANTGVGGSAGYSPVSPFGGNGGGNGGAGGFVGGIQPIGGAGYNEVFSPKEAGSGGGGFVPYSIGGYGGGAVNLVVDGMLQVDGVISANGGDGSGVGGGGGAGGSLAISAGTISGSGAITANGGDGVDGTGGGGGGGCIAITFNTSLFAGTLSAFGGTGANDGGAGTIYFKTNSSAFGQVIVDNGGESGASSVIESQNFPPNANLTVGDNSVLYYGPGQPSLTLGNLLVSNASLIVSNYPLIITANNVTLQNGGRIIADAAGYPQGQGPGAGRYFQGIQNGIEQFEGSGGGNGGCGGMAFSNSVPGGGVAFEPYTEAMEPGSGGGGISPYVLGGTGGGVIELNVSGTLAVNGTLSANGGNGLGSGGGGGSGGSLNLHIGSLTGSGVISANGGAGANNIGGGGGGGAIAIDFQSSTFSNTFNGSISAYGGVGWTNGGAGTIFIDSNYTEKATLILDNGGNRGTNTPITTSSSAYSLVIRNGAIAAIPSQQDFSSLLIASNGWLVPEINNQGQAGQINLLLSGNATIQAGGGIIADSYGYPQNTWSGHGLVDGMYSCSGAGHGGYGAFGVSNVPGGITYDSIQEPEQAGSGGGGYSPYSTGGAGGGYIDLDLTSGGALQVNGIISANGGNGSGLGGGGGSGGGIYLTAGTISGSGSITANGGNGALKIGGGGGGGCISLNCTIGFQTNTFHGGISAYGGGGANYGGAGTLYYRTNNTLGAGFVGMLYLDNNNNVGTDTTLSAQSVGIVTIRNGAIGLIPSDFFLAQDEVDVLSNATLTSLQGQTTIQVPNMTVAAGGVVSVDGRGSGAGAGTGAGSGNWTVSGGGGHGGYGGGDISGGGAAYDSIVAPALAGSGGANSRTASGGAGGGALILDVTENLILNGRISANGVSGGIDAGGGSGGSIFIPKGLNFSGSGTISANGGAGSESGGGGGGGRIALSAGNDRFTGQYSASGGGGAYPGGAGTIYVYGHGTPTLLVNNGGNAGTNTPLSSGFALPSTSFDLDISGGASVLPLTPLPLLDDLNLSAASTLTMAVAQTNFFIGVLSNATIAGNLTVDDLGYSQMNGPGAGVSIDSEGSGGGYGGAGGASESGAQGGATYGSSVAPTYFGSGGGSGADTTMGGSSGGGALRLSVAGTLTVSGNISANGDSGLQDDSGGGSGGSVWITAGTLSGAGTISAAGGDGVLYGGGGGGGGRIAIYAPINQFTGTTNVGGGTGAMPGQSGTVSLSSAFDGLQVLSQSPTGMVMNTVSSLNLTFSGMLSSGSVSASDFTLVTPAGPLSQSSLGVAVTSPYSVQISFPTQNLEGTYTVQVGTAISDLFGQSLTQPYAGTFTVSLPTISGTVTGTNGAGVAGVSMQASGGLIAATTDTNGNYSLGVPPGWTGTVTPSLGSNAFVPSSMSYTNVTVSLTGQNYLMVQTLSPALTTCVSGGNCSLNWNGVGGVTYQVLWSTNLVTWQPFGSPITGTNGPMQFNMPAGSNSQEFFQLQVGD